MASPTTFADIHPDIIRTHVLPRIDGPSLSAAANASSYLKTLSADQNIWSDICKSNWPSITDPRVDKVISTFPAGHRTFFEDSFPVQTTEDNPRGHHIDRSSHPWPPQLISAIDIRYQNQIIYSGVIFTETTTEYLSKALWIELNNTTSKPGISRPIDVNVDNLGVADDATISHLKESITLSWILVDPSRKRAGNLSSIKPVLARQHWLTSDIHLRYVTVLPGCDPDELVQCKIELMLVACKGKLGLHVKQVSLHVQDLFCCCSSRKDFLVITQRALSEENNVKRSKVVGDNDTRERMYKEFKEMKKQKMEGVNIKEKQRDSVIRACYIIFFTFTCILFIKRYILC